MINDNREPWKWADSFVVLAGKQFNATLANGPLTSGLKIELLSLDDETQPHKTLPFYGIFLGDKPYTKELDDKRWKPLHLDGRWRRRP